LPGWLVSFQPQNVGHVYGGRLQEATLLPMLTILLHISGLTPGRVDDKCRWIHFLENSNIDMSKIVSYSI